MHGVSNAARGGKGILPLDHRAEASRIHESSDSDHRVAACSIESTFSKRRQPTKRPDQREPADSLRDNSSVTGGQIPSLTCADRSMTFPFDFQLVTPRCRLRAPVPADIPHIFSATRHHGFNDGLLWDAPGSEDELIASEERSRKAWRDGERFIFSLETKEDALFLGRIGLGRTQDPTRWRLGFWLHPDGQGKGFMTEAALAIIQFGFERLGAGAIEACHAVWNVRSRRVLERVGMREIEHRAHGFLKRGEWVSEVLMRIEKGPAQW